VWEIRLYVSQDNPRAIRAYEKSGFVGGEYQMMIRSVL
jgi:ribosomal protein S18 acetylase RimI-like enzyme